MTFSETHHLDSSLHGKWRKSPVEEHAPDLKLKWVADFRYAFAVFEAEYDRVDQRGDTDMLTWARRNAGEMLAALRNQKEFDLMQAALKHGQTSKIFEIAAEVLR
jgi:hypothetical protein